MSISPRFMAELRDRLTLSEIVGRRVKLTRAGREFKGCCPFHNEKTPSFYVNDDKQFYHCFGCGAHGDAVGFVMQNSNISFIEAVEMLAGEAGLEVPQQTPQEIQKAKQQKDLYDLMEAATQFFEEKLYRPAGKEALQYLQQRGVKEDSLSSFRIGFAPDDAQALYRHLRKEGYSEEQMIESSLIRPSKKGGDPYAFFRERVMFPVTDRRGRVVAYGGRILPDHLRAPDRGSFKPPKYMNSSDTPLFHKGRMLYGESHARQAASDGELVIVVEGYLDVIACFEAGWRGAVAPLGTAMTEDQIASLWKMIPDDRKVPVLCFDGDEAGRRAAARACERILPLLKPNHSARIAFLPEGQDPDSLIKAQGKKAFENVLEGAMSLNEFLWHNHTTGRTFETPEERAGLVKTLEEETLRIPDRSVQQFYQQAFRDKQYQFFRKNNFTKGRGNYGANQHKGQGLKVNRPSFSGHALQEKILLAALINHPQLFEHAEDELDRLPMTNKRLDFVRQAIVNLLSGDNTIDAEALRTHLMEQGLETELKAILSESTYTHAGFARPNTDFDEVLEGWDEVCGSFYKAAFGLEMKEARRALANDFTEENEQRMIALLNSQKSKDS